METWLTTRSTPERMVFTMRADLNRRLDRIQTIAARVPQGSMTDRKVIELMDAGRGTPTDLTSVFRIIGDDIKTNVMLHAWIRRLDRANGALGMVPGHAIGPAIDLVSYWSDEEPERLWFEPYEPDRWREPHKMPIFNNAPPEFHWRIWARSFLMRLVCQEPSAMALRQELDQWQETGPDLAYVERFPTDRVRRLVAPIEDLEMDTYLLRQRPNQR